MALSTLDDDVKVQFSSLRENYINVQVLFQFGYMDSSEDPMCGDEFGNQNEFWLVLSQEDRQKALRSFLKLLSAENVQGILLSCFDFIQYLVSNAVFTQKEVCDELLTSCNEDSLKNPKYIIEMVKFIESLLSKIDYKGCRDIFTKVLHIVCPVLGPGVPLPNTNSDAEKPLYSLFETMLDRKKSHMPAYFALHEITKLTSQCYIPPIMKKLISNFTKEFDNVTSLFTHPVCKLIIPVSGLSSPLILPANLAQIQHFNLSTSLNYYHPFVLNTQSGALDLKGPLPYAEDLLEPHMTLVKGLLIQPGSKDMLLGCLGLAKEGRGQIKGLRCPCLEKCLVDLLVWAVQETEVCHTPQEQAWVDQLWLHLSQNALFLCTFHFVRFPELCHALYHGIKDLGSLVNSRGKIAWLLLNFFGAQQKNPLSDFTQVLRIVDVLYTSYSDDCDVVLLIWFCLTKKSELSEEKLPRKLPPPLQPFIKQLNERFQVMIQAPDFQVQLDPQNFTWFSHVYNAYSPLSISQNLNNLNSKLIDALHISTMPYESIAQLATMSLLAITNLLFRILSTAQHKANPQCPGLIETYTRTLYACKNLHMLSYKPLALDPNIFKTGTPFFVQLTLELFTFHMSCFDLIHRQFFTNSLVSTLKGAAANSFPSAGQQPVPFCELELCLYRQFSVLLAPSLQLTSNHVKRLYNNWILDHDELGRHLLLLLCQQANQQLADPDGSLFTEFVNPLFQRCTAACAVSLTMKQHLPQSSERLHVPDSALTVQQQQEMDQICLRFIREGFHDENLILSANALYYVAFKASFERNTFPLLLFTRAIEKLGQKGCLQHLRVFCDLLVCDYCNSVNPDSLIQHLIVIIFQHKLIQLHRFILVLVLRPFKERRMEEASLSIVSQLLSTQQPAPSPISVLVPLLLAHPPDNCNLADLSINIQSAFKETIAPGVLYSNMCFKVTQISETVITRLLQVEPPDTLAFSLLENLAPFLRQHDRSLSVLVNLLFSFTNCKRSLLTKLVHVMLSPKMGELPEGWALSPQAWELVNSNSLSFEQLSLQKAVQKLSITFSSYGRHGFPALDWSMHEFPNVFAHAVYVTLIELLFFPPEMLSREFKSLLAEPDCDFNVLGMVFSQLPSQHFQTHILTPVLDILTELRSLPAKDYFTYMQDQPHPQLSLWFAFFWHIGVGRTTELPSLFRNSVKQRIETESQFLFVCQLFGPLLDRIKALYEIVSDFYMCLCDLDQSIGGDFVHQDTIADFFYHLKYMFVGDGVKRTASSVIEKLSPGLQTRLRFIAPVPTLSETADTPSNCGHSNTPLMPSMVE